MENNKQAQGMMPGAVSINDLIDENVVYVFRTRYDDLIRAEMEREILFHAYQQMNHYDLEKVLDAVFNPKFKYREQNDA